MMSCTHTDVGIAAKDDASVEPNIPRIELDMDHFERLPRIPFDQQPPEFSDGSYAYYCVRKKHCNNYVVLIKVNATVSSRYGIDELAMVIPKNGGEMQYRHAKEYSCEEDEKTFSAQYEFGEKNQGVQELPLEVMATDCKGNAAGLEFVENCDAFERHWP